MAELSDIYNSKIMELASGISRGKRLTHANATATQHSKLCGSTISVDLEVRNNVVTDYGQTVKACLLGQAAASVMAREIVGSTVLEVRDVGVTMRAMLKASGPAPTGRWADLAVLEPVRAVKARQASALLVFDAVDAALRMIDEQAVANGELASQ